MRLLGRPGKSVRFLLWLSAVSILSSCLDPTPLKKVDPVNLAGGSKLEGTLAYLSGLQSSTTGLVSASTYENAISAIAFARCGHFEKAERIFMEFPVGGDQIPEGAIACQPGATTGEEWTRCVCEGGYRQSREAVIELNTEAGIENDTEMDTEANHQPQLIGPFRVEDAAWLAAAVEYYRRVVPVSDNPTVDDHINQLIAQMRSWFLCLGAQTVALGETGIHAGYCGDGRLKGPDQKCYGDPDWTLEMDAGGSIDVYGALRYSAPSDDNIQKLQENIKTWIDGHVWLPAGSCFDRGRDDSAALPAELVAWGMMSLAPDDSSYNCLMEDYAGLFRRSLSKSVIADFEDDFVDDWTFVPLDFASLTAENGQARVDWDWGERPISQEWFLFNRNICLPVSNQFDYCLDFSTTVDEAQWFEVKFNPAAGADAGQYIYPFLDMSLLGGELCVSYDDLVGLGGDSPGENGAFLGGIEFAVNADVAEIAAPSSGAIWLDDIRYEDDAPVEGFSDLENEADRIGVSITAAMATAYCLTGEKENYMHYLEQLDGWRLEATTRGQGLPPELTPKSSLDCIASVEATSWYIIAKHCFNPFAGQ